MKRNKRIQNLSNSLSDKVFLIEIQTSSSPDSKKIRIKKRRRYAA